MNFKRMMFKTTALFGVVFVFAACDDEFSNVGGDIIENPSDLKVEEVEVQAYNKKINSVQTNNLSTNLLGVYNHPVYGQSVASILSQIALSTKNPTFGTAPELDSVVLTIPYFSTEGDLDEDGNIEYALDSVYGNTPIKISIQESNYFLSNLDPEMDFKDRQKYYSNQQELFEQNLVGDVLFENDNFIPSKQPIVSYEENKDGVEDTISKGPALRIKLPVAYFKEKIVDKEGSSVLSNNNNFRNYLRGLFIKAEPTAENGSMILFNLRSGDAGIKLFYTSEVKSTNDDGEEETIRKKRDYKIDFGQNIVNTFEGEYPGDILQAIEDSNEESGAENLFLKGGEGSMAVIELFDSEVQIEALRENNWLINEANLFFYVDSDFLQGVNEPERLYIYDLDNNRIIADYSFSVNFIKDLNEKNPARSLLSFSKPLERDADENGIRYKLNITQHVTNILENEADNVRLGLAVTQNINQTNNSAVKNIEEVEFFPAASVINPKGTVLHGNLSSDEDKRLKLRIYYTETE